VEQFGLESLCRTALAFFPNVCVHTQRGGDIGMSQLSLRDPWMHSHGSQMASMKVPQAVPGETWQAQLGQRGVQLAPSHILWVERSPVLVLKDEPRTDPPLSKVRPKVCGKDRSN